MKHLLLLAALTAWIPAAAQKTSTYFNQLTELKGTDYTIASASEGSKGSDDSRSYLLFINTRTGERQEVDLSFNSYYGHNFEQVNDDKLNLHLVLISGTKGSDAGATKGLIDRERHLFAFSPDGKQQTQISDPRFFLSAWSLNAQTGRIVMTGHYDSNDNGKQDRHDEPRVMLYDLTTMKAIAGN